MRLVASLGRAAGWAAAPLFFAAGAARRDRTFHPRGLAWAADAEACADRDDTRIVAARLEGRALVRLSNSLWKRAMSLPDVLGCAIRFGAIAETPAPGDQDLLAVTSMSFARLPISLFTTDVADFLDNVYEGMSWFEIDGVGRCRVRFVPEHRSPDAADREARLVGAVRDGIASIRVEIRREGEDRWDPLVRVHLRAIAAIDPHRLRFDPLRDGAGIRPVGFLQEMRLGAYSASQAGRTFARGVTEGLLASGHVIRRPVS